MKYSSIFKTFIQCDSSQEVFDYLKSNLVDSINFWNYFVDWNKVLQSVRKIEVELNTLNYLIGKDDLEKEFKYLVQKQPSVLKAIPLLLACRENDFTILANYEGEGLEFENFSFSNLQNLSDFEIDKSFDFISRTGLINLFKDKTIKSIPDYVIGVEVGLDSNGRKNRSGTAMEQIVEKLLAKVCQKTCLEYMVQANADKLLNQWKINLKVDKSSRRFDFAVKGNNGELFLIETNYYSGGGSKLKSTCGEYKHLFDFLSSEGHKFIWITDGLGWKTALKPLEEAFSHIDYVCNLKMISDGVLSEVLMGEMKC